MSEYVLLTKQPVELPTDIILVTLAEFRKSHREAIQSFSSGPVGYDIEANTYDYCAPGFSMRTVGLCNDDYCYSIDLLGASEEDLTGFKTWMMTLEYAAFNVMMEAGSNQTWAGGVGKPIADCYILFADLATEYRRPLNLETAMADLLGQQKEGDKVKDHMKANKWTWTDVDKFDFEILGRYNAIDAWGAWELYKYFNRLIETYKDTWGQYYWQYHREDCLNAAILQVEARHKGIYVESEALEESYSTLCTKRDVGWSTFLEHETVEPHIKCFNQETLDTLKSTEPKKRTKANGEPTVIYTKWAARLEAAKEVQHFNPNSTKQLRWLFFDRMNIEPIEFTDTGAPSTAAACLKKMGPEAKLLLEYRGYITQLKFLTQVRNGQQDGVIKPSVKIWATLTTRSGGGRLE